MSEEEAATQNLLVAAIRAAGEKYRAEKGAAGEGLSRRAFMVECPAAEIALRITWALSDMGYTIERKRPAVRLRSAPEHLRDCREAGALLGLGGEEARDYQIGYRGSDQTFHLYIFGDDYLSDEMGAQRGEYYAALFEGRAREGGWGFVNLGAGRGPGVRPSVWMRFRLLRGAAEGGRDG